MNPRLELEIGELILRGLPYAQRHAIAAAIEAELTRMLAERGLPPGLATGETIPDVRLSGLQFTEGARPGAIGADIAGQIYARLTAGGVSANPQPPASGVAS